MKKIYFTVGPSQVYPTLYKHMDRAIKNNIPSISHRGSEFKQIFKETTEGLRKLLSIPENFQIFFVSSALESMERTIQSCCGKTSFHIITGSFGKTWAKLAAELGRKTITYELKNDTAAFPELKISAKAEIICITQNETSTGFWIPPSEIIKLKERYPEKLMAIDIVSSVPYADIDFKYIDIAFFSVQKGFGLPAGLGVIIVSPKALEKTEELIRKGVVTGSYHCFKKLSEKGEKFQTPETPNVLNIYLLNNVIKHMLKVGVDKIRKDTDEKAKNLYKFFENHTKYDLFIKHPGFRSPTTIVIDVKGESEKLRKKLAKIGYIVGAGYGDNKLNHIRIANFPAHKLNDVKLMLKYIS